METSLAETLKELQEKTGVETIEVSKGDANSCTIFSVPHGRNLKSAKPFLDSYLETPERRKGTSYHDSLESFIKHVNRFQTATSVLFGKVESKDSAKITCVFDYNPEGKEITSAENLAHHAVFTFPISEEWKHWIDNNAKSFEQADFAAFIEDNINDIAYLDDEAVADLKENDAVLGKALQHLNSGIATPNKLVALSRGLSVNENARVKSHQNLQTGEAQISYETEHTDEQGNSINVPGFFMLSIPVVDEGKPNHILARLRYRVHGGSIKWFYQLFRPDLMMKKAIRESFGEAEDQTNLPFFIGQAETLN